MTGDLGALKRFLALQFSGRLPGVEALNGVARLIKDAIVGKGGSIATPDFFKSQHDGLGAWLMGRQRDPAELERLCSGIRTSLNKNQWTLEFNVLSGAGGVDIVRASGTPAPLTLTNISVGVLKSQGEFGYHRRARHSSRQTSACEILAACRFGNIRIDALPERHAR